MTQPIQLNQFGQWSTSEKALRASNEPVRSLYLHVPFCFHKCHYCDFYSFVDSRDRQGDFAEALIQEMRAAASSVSEDGSRPELETIFVGGGTPTLLKPEYWQKILRALHEVFDVPPSCEFSVESNPETTTEEVLRVLRSGGVNRVSIGAQTFNPVHLTTLERHHNPENVRRALERAKDASIERRSIDLIFAIPGQTLDDLRDDLSRALDLGDLVEHLSLYNLMYEPNTALTQRVRAGGIEPISEETEIEMYQLVVEALADAGFASYEISNFARPGAECRHNLAYWQQSPWLACGPSASAHVGGWRWKNVPHLTKWMQSVRANDGFSAVTDLEPPDASRALAERLMTGIRLTRGLDAGDLLDDAQRLGVRAPIEAAAESLVRDGIITIEAHRYRLTDEGVLLADEAGVRFLEALELTDAP